MEADWSAEVGPELPEMNIPWEGFIDLRGNLDRIDEVTEASQHRALADALRFLNGSSSQFFTSKCDAWTLPAEEIDADEFGAQQGSALSGFASYIDLLCRQPANYASFEFHESMARQITRMLRAEPSANSRIELVVRPAEVDHTPGYGTTLYAAACGATQAEAAASWNLVLALAVLATINAGLTANAAFNADADSIGASSSIG